MGCVAGEGSILATLGHEREGGFLLLGPVAAHIGVREMSVPNWLNVHNVDKLSKPSGPQNLGQRLAVGRIPQDYHASDSALVRREYMRTVTHSKDNAGLLDRVLDPQTVLD